MTTDMALDAIAGLCEKARRAPQRVVLPEAEEENILRAARAAVDQGLAKPVLLGSPELLAAEAARAGVDLSGIEILDVTDEAVLAELAGTAARLFPSMSARRIERKLRDRLSLGSLLVAAGRADALVAGLLHTTQEVIVASLSFIAPPGGGVEAGEPVLDACAGSRRAGGRARSSLPIAASPCRRTPPSWPRSPS